MPPMNFGVARRIIDDAIGNRKTVCRTSPLH
jgi:hypothetical protein